MTPPIGANSTIPQVEGQHETGYDPAGNMPWRARNMRCAIKGDRQ
jgi:hypothetical protein